MRRKPDETSAHNWLGKKAAEENQKTISPGTIFFGILNQNSFRIPFTPVCLVKCELTKNDPYPYTVQYVEYSKP